MNFLDAVISYVNPNAGLTRARNRMALDVIERGYNTASNGRRNPGSWFNTHGSAASEVSKAADKLSNVGQELCRNNPLAHRIKMVWASNIVGKGISFEAKGKNKQLTERFNLETKAWAESTACDFEGHHNLYGLEWLWVCTIVETGGVFVRKHINNAMKMPLQLQTIEQTLLDKGKNDGRKIIDGIQFNNDGQIEGYWILSDKSGMNISGEQESKFYRKDVEMIHMFRKERSTQHLGIMWLNQSAPMLDKYDTLQDAKVMQQQILACLALFIEESNTAISNGKDSQGTSDVPDSIEPGTINYVNAGSKVHAVTPPNASDSGGFITELKNDIAVGAGITYSQLTGDYSKFNFASGRMGKIDFFNGLDHAQNLMMLPGLNTIFDWLTKLFSIKYGSSDFTADWTFPTRAAVNPKEEFEVLMAKVRHGMMSPSKAAKQLGENFPDVVDGWLKDKKIMKGLPFDIDPSMFSSAGNQLNVDDAASGNAEGTPEDNRSLNAFFDAVSRELNNESQSE